MNKMTEVRNENYLAIIFLTWAVSPIISLLISSPGLLRLQTSSLVMFVLSVVFLMVASFGKREKIVRYIIAILFGIALIVVSSYMVARWLL